MYDSPKAIVGGTLIDGTGKPPVKNSVIVIQGSKIADVRTPCKPHKNFLIESTWRMDKE